MKKTNKLLGLVGALAIAAIATGCVTGTNIGGASGSHGLLTGHGAAADANRGGTEIASYTVILGLIDAGHADYAAKVKAAEDQGKKVTSKTVWYVFATKTTAYAK